MKMLAYLLAFICATACADKALVNKNTDSNNNDSSAYSYLALGDSYTIGQSVATNMAFPIQLSASLKNSCYNVAKPTIIAQTGWTSSDLINAISAAKIQKKYQIVTLLIGVNNQYQGEDIDNYQKEFVQLLQTAIAFADGKESHVFVVSIPDWGVTPFANGYNRTQIASEIDAYNLINQQETAKTKAHYINITPISREAATKSNYIAGDGLHPSGVMYAEWVKLLNVAISAEIKKS